MSDKAWRAAYVVVGLLLYFAAADIVAHLTGWDRAWILAGFAMSHILLERSKVVL
jgi:type IV secretory pathway VirB2 component (pilin)